MLKGHFYQLSHREGIIERLSDIAWVRISNPLVRLQDVWKCHILLSKGFLKKSEPPKDYKTETVQDDDIWWCLPTFTVSCSTLRGHLMNASNINVSKIPFCRLIRNIGLASLRPAVRITLTTAHHKPVFSAIRSTSGGQKMPMEKTAIYRWVPLYYIIEW